MTEKRYPHERYAKLLASVSAEMEKLGTLKGGEYAGDVDRLANFRRNGEKLGLPMETVWAVYCSKHFDAIMQYVQDERIGVQRTRMEGIEGRVHDVMVYCVLFLAMLDEAKNFNPATGKWDEEKSIREIVGDIAR